MNESFFYEYYAIHDLYINEILITDDMLRLSGFRTKYHYKPVIKPFSLFCLLEMNYIMTEPARLAFSWQSKKYESK